MLGACGEWSIISNFHKDWATSGDLGKMAYFLVQLAIKEAPNTVGLSDQSPFFRLQFGYAALRPPVHRHREMSEAEV
jgi:hypothetical protein